MSLEHERIVFSGSDGGAMLINFNGDTVGSLQPETLYNLEGAEFIGANHDIVLGGNGVHIWDPVSGAFDTVVDSGSYPVSNGAGQIWFNAFDGAVSYYDLQRKKVSPVVSLSGVEMTDTGYAQPVLFSVDRRMVFARLAGKRELNSVEYAEKERIYEQNSMALRSRDKYCHIHYLCVIDTKERTLWKYPDYAHNAAWVAGEYYDV